MIKFSIITVCLNAGADLTETVEHSLNQTYGNFEIIVKDGMSTDGSVAKLPSDPRIQLVCKKDTGIYDAMNQALDYITGDYVIFMNCGDKFYAENTLENIACSIEKCRDEVYYGLNYNREWKRVGTCPRKITEFTCFRTMICHQATVYTADIFKDKRYDVSYTIYADRELLWYLVCTKKISPTYLDEIIADYKGNGESENAKYKEKNMLDKKRLEKQYLSPIKRIGYQIMYAMTLPQLRTFIAENPKYRTAYFNFVKLFYKITG